MILNINDNLIQNKLAGAKFIPIMDTAFTISDKSIIVQENAIYKLN